jgi:hypothetical protein
MVKAFRGDHCIRSPEMELTLTVTVKPGINILPEMFKVTLLEKTKITIANDGSRFRFFTVVPTRIDYPKMVEKPNLLILCFILLLLSKSACFYKPSIAHGNILSY